MFFQPLNPKVTLPEPLPCPKSELHDFLVEVTVYKQDGTVKASRVLESKDLIEDH